MNDIVSRENEARALLKSQMGVIQTLTNKDEAKASVFASAILAQVTNRNLAGCSVESIVKNGIEIVRLGLNPNPTFGQAYIVPFNGKNGVTAQLQIGYKGFIGLAYRNGWVFRAVCVYSCDEFNIEFAGINDKITYKPSYENRQDDNAEWVHKNLRGVIVYAKDSQNVEFSEFVPFSKLEKLRLKSQNQNDKNSLKYIWADWSEEMYKAKALKYVATRLPITEQIQSAINSENVVFQNENTIPQSEKSEALDLNAIVAEADSEAGEPKKQVVKVRGARGELMKLLQERGFNEFEIDEFMAQVVKTSTIAESLLNNSELLEQKFKEFFE